MIPLRDTVRSRSFPWVNWTLIALNVGIFLFFEVGSPHVATLMKTWGLVPKRLLLHPNLYNFVTLFTSMFLHGGWSHLISNMLALYIFGDNVEDRLGSGRYLVFYLLCGLAAAFTHVGFNPLSNMPTVGASGAISGVLAAYVVLFPTASVITLIPLFFWPWFVEIPALIYIGGWFVSQLFNGVASVVVGVQALGGVAWWAHVGGFVAGLLLLPVFKRRQPRVVYYYPEDYFPW